MNRKLKCPKTGDSVTTEIVVRTFVDGANSPNREQVLCSACGQWHDWQEVDDLLHTLDSLNAGLAPG